MTTKTKKKRVSRSILVNQYLSRIASGKLTKRVQKKLARTKAGRRLRAKNRRH